MKPHYVQGDYNVNCQTCGRAYKSSAVREQWDGIVACPRCYDSKHPDLEPRIAPPEDTFLPNANPRPSFANLTFINTPGLSVWGGVMNNGVDYGTEFTWAEMDIDWDEFETASDEITLR